MPFYGGLGATHDMKLLITLLLFICAAQYSVAQTYTIRGKVSDTMNVTPLFRASIVVIRGKDSVIESYTRTAADGTFKIGVSAKGKYILRVTFPSFADYLETLNINSDTTDLGELPMISKAHLLTEFVLTQQVSAIKIKGDTTEYMADSFKVKDNATVEDLLKKLPGIQVDKNGQIVAQGETVQKILVDGEEFFSDDPKVVTKGLLANAVTKVQVYDKKSDQAEFTGIDDGQKTKTINLELKESRKKGFFGKADVGGGTDGYFQNQLMINAFKGKRQISAFGIASNTDKVGLGWNDNDKFGGGGGIAEITDNGYSISGGSYDEFGGWNGRYNGEGLPKVWTGGVHFADRWNEDKSHVSVNYRYAQQNVDIDGNNTTQYALSGDTTRVNTEHKLQSSRVERHGIDGFYEWKIDSNTSFRFIGSGGIKNSDVSSFYHTETWNMTPDAGTPTVNDRLLTGTKKSEFVNADVLFRRKFAKKGRTLSIDAKENYNVSTGIGHLNSTTVGVDSTDQKKVDTSATLAFSSKATYTEPLSKTVFLELDYGVTVNNSRSSYYSFDKLPGSSDYGALNDTFSSNYQYNILTNQGGLNFRFIFKKTSFYFGSDVSSTNYVQTDKLRGTPAYNYSYPNIYPRANFTYNFRKQTTLRFSYEGDTKQPTINQIQPLQQNTDPLNITIGNTGLKQEFNNRLSLRFNDYKILTRRYMWAGASFTYNQDAISTAQTVNGPVSTTQYVNVNGNYTGNWWSGYDFSFKKSNLGMGFSASGTVSRINNYINGERNTSNNNSYTFGPNLRLEKENKYEFRFDPEVTYNDNRSTINLYSANYWVFNCQFNAQVQLPKKFEAGSTIDAMLRQKTVIFPDNNEVIKWNAYVSKKLLKKSELEIRLTLYDILNQNLGYSRTAQGNTVSQQSYNTIRRYLMLGVIWNFSHSPGAPPAEENK